MSKAAIWAGAQPKQYVRGLILLAVCLLFERPLYDDLYLQRLSETPRKRFIRNFKGTELSGLPFSQMWCIVQQCLINVMFNDEGRLLDRLSLSLGHIDRKMEDDCNLRQSIGPWRSLFGRWRAYLYSKDRSISEILRNVKNLQEAYAEKQAKVSDGPIHATGQLEQQHEQLNFKLAAVLKHFESSFGALMATMSILESQAAIAEAGEVSKLTKLAFFFIPLTFAAGVCGMNLAVSHSYLCAPVKNFLITERPGV